MTYNIVIFVEMAILSGVVSWVEDMGGTPTPVGEYVRLIHFQNYKPKIVSTIDINGRNIIIFNDH